MKCCLNVVTPLQLLAKSLWHLKLLIFLSILVPVTSAVLRLTSPQPVMLQEPQRYGAMVTLKPQELRTSKLLLGIGKEVLCCLDSCKESLFFVKVKSQLGLLSPKGRGSAMAF